MNTLQRIVAERRADAQAARREVSLETLRERAAGRTHHSLTARLRAGGGTRIVAETKKASPSAGVLRVDYRPADIARLYAGAGACAISVLTEPRRFMGGGGDLSAVRAAVDLPVLRKDFIGDAYQIAEAAAWGADVALLIVAALEEPELRDLYACARGYGLDVLAEAHTAAELDLALELPEAIVGVNSRDLKTLRTDLAVARELAGRIPAGRLSIAESGIRARTDIESLEALGYDAFLVGESILRAADPAAKLRELLGS
jgi:indole-3-glycerol phosphate synthase